MKGPVMASERDKMISTIVSVGMLRRDVATDIADALLAKWWVQAKPDDAEKVRLPEPEWDAYNRTFIE